MDKSALIKKILLAASVFIVILFELLKYLFSVRLIAVASCAEIVLAAVSVFCLFSDKRSLKIAAALLLAFALITFIPNMIIGFNKTEAPTEPQYVIHAGGRERSDKTYLNCGEPLEKYLAEGQKLVEIDFMLTSDGYVVCTHWFEHTPYSKKNRPTLAEFMSYEIGGKYKAMSFEGLIEILQKYPQARIVFDSKEDDIIEILSVMCTVAENKGLDIYSRFVIQIYGADDYYNVKARFPEFAEYWFTNYKASYPFTKMLKLFEDKEDITTYVICKESWCCYALCMLNTDKNIAVHTENLSANSKFYCARGVTYVYADYV